MKKQYLITGANGHLGGTIIRMLSGPDTQIYGLLLPGEKGGSWENVEYIYGDVRDIESLKPFFERADNAVVIHTAGIVDIAGKVTPGMYDVNVNGTKNIISMCRGYSVRRLVYVSSVHAIPEGDKDSVTNEVKRFSPDLVVGGYAKTKAEATQAVMAAAGEGLDVVVVHPSGILGPYDASGNHLVQMVKDYVAGKLPACVRGGYDFVDVRDVAAGCITAGEMGKAGECYILSNRHYEVKEVLRIAKRECGGRRLPVLPMWMAKAAAPFFAWLARRRKERPLYTGYSLYTLESNDRFSHDKATAELGYRPRDLKLTIRDTIRG